MAKSQQVLSLHVLRQRQLTTQPTRQVAASNQTCTSGGIPPPRGLEQMVKYSRDKAVAGLLRRLVHDGWRFHMRGRHGKLVSPEGRRLPVPCTPSDYRAVDNFKRDLRKLMPFYTRLT